MRLVKLAVASVSPTVGAVRSNTAAMVTARPARWPTTDVTLGAFPGAGGRRLPARGPGPVARPSSTPSGASSSGSPRETADAADGVRARAGGARCGGSSSTPRRSCTAAASSASSPRRSCRPTTCSTRRAPSRAAGPGSPSTPTACRSATTSSPSTSAPLAVEVCEDVWSPDGPMRRRCYSGAEIVVNVSASPYRAGRRRRPAARCSRPRSADNQTVLLYANAVGAQDGLIFDGGGFVFQNGRPDARGAALPRGLRRRRSSTSIARAGCGSENTTWRTDCEAFAPASAPVPVHPQRRRADRRPRDGWPIRRRPAAASSCRRRRRQPVDARDEVLDDLFEALALGVRELLPQDRRLPLARASRSPAAATRC